MLHLIITRKLKVVTLVIGTLFSANLFAQSEKAADSSTIVMSESELKSFLTTIADARRSQLQEREAEKKKQSLDQLRLKYQDRNVVPNGNDNYSTQQVLRELRYLNERVDNLSSQNNRVPSLGRDNSTIILPGSTSSAVPAAYSGNSGSTTTIIPSNRKKIDELQSKIDSLNVVKADLANLTYQNSIADSLSRLTNRLSDVRRAMDSLESKMIASKKVDLIVESKEDYSYFKQQVYFDNNSDKLRAGYLTYIQDLTRILIQYPESKILLEGWASPIGKTAYNKQLSMRRAESVEKVFLNNGVETSRILTAFRGEDQSSSEQLARRVDMSIIVK
jgi:outer membrane protein OmpA-like peptidoglycan-associated protein